MKKHSTHLAILGLVHEGEKAVRVYYAGAGWLPGFLVYFYSGHDKPASFISLTRVPMGSAGGR